MSTTTIELLRKTQKEFLWGKISLRLNMTPYVMTMRMEDIIKIVSLQCSWIRRSYDENFHPWKVIPLYLIEMHFGKNFKFHPNLDLREFSLNTF